MNAGLKKTITRVLLSIALTLLRAASNLSRATAADKTVLAEGLDNPESAVVANDGRLYVTLTSKAGVQGDGKVVAIEDGKAKLIAQGMNDPREIGRTGKEFVVADMTKVWRIDAVGDLSVLVDADAFPVKPRFLNDLEIGADGDIFVSDSGTFVANGAVYRITPDKKVSIVADTKTAPALKGPNGLLVDGKDHLLLVDVAAGKLYRAQFSNGEAVTVASGVTGADCIERDPKGRIYIGDVRGGRVFRLDSPSAKPSVFIDGFKSAADIRFDDKGRLLVPDSKAGTLTAVLVSD